MIHKKIIYYTIFYLKYDVSYTYAKEMCKTLYKNFSLPHSYLTLSLEFQENSIIVLAKNQKKSIKRLFNLN